MNAEQRLLCECSILYQGEEKSKRIADILRLEPNWEIVWDQAYAHHIIPLLRENLVPVEAQVPSDFFAHVQDHSRQIALRNLALAGELIQILRLFAASNITAIPLKGPVLATIAYGDLSLRTSNDLDIVVHLEDREKAAELLLGMGYRFSEAQSDRMKNKVEHLTHHYQFINEKNIVLELHWSLSQLFFSPKGETELMWSHATPSLWFGISILMPKPEDMLLYLCQHGARHSWMRLLWISDVAQTIHTFGHQLDWDYLFAQAEEMNITRIFLLGLSLVHRCLTKICC